MYDYILKKEKVWWNPSTWDEDECKLVLSAAVCIGSIVIDCITKANTKKFAGKCFTVPGTQDAEY